MCMTRSQAHRLEAGSAVMPEASQGARGAVRWAWEHALRVAYRILWRALVPLDDIPASDLRGRSDCFGGVGSQAPLPREWGRRSDASPIRRKGY